MNYAQSIRLDYIDAMMAEKRELRRNDIAEKFRVHVVTASHDIRRFMAEHPGAIEYDASLKRYVPATAIYVARR